MIITLKSADFSVNNIGTLDSWMISTSLDIGAIYQGATRVNKGGSFVGTIIINSSYELDGNITVIMGGNIVSGVVSGSGNSYTITIGNVTGNVNIVVNTKVKENGGEVDPSDPTPEPEPEPEEVKYTLTINPNPSDATVVMNGNNQKSITVSKGQTVIWSVSKTGYTIQSGSWTANANETKNIVLTAESANSATLTVNAAPAGVQIHTYAPDNKKIAGGGKSSTGSGSITVVNDGTASPTWQVTKDEYISNGGTVSGIKKDVVKNITLVPFSDGKWSKIDMSTFDTVSKYFISAAGKNSGPYNTWSYIICPVEPGKKYRVISTAGQSALLWMFFKEKPVGDGSIQPISKSTNSGMTTKIADEVTAPDEAAWMTINSRTNSTDYKATLQVYEGVS